MTRLTSITALVSLLMATTAHAQYTAWGLGYKPCSWLNTMTDSADKLGTEITLEAWLAGYVTGINMTLMELSISATPPLSVRNHTNSRGYVDVMNSTSQTGLTALADVVHEKCRKYPDMLISLAAATSIDFFKK